MARYFLKFKGKSSSAVCGYINFKSRIKKEYNARDGGCHLSREALSLDFVEDDLINKTLVFDKAIITGGENSAKAKPAGL